MARGRGVSRKAPGVKRKPELSGGCQAAKGAQDDQKAAKLRVARKAPNSLDYADQSGAGVAE